MMRALTPDALRLASAPDSLVPVPCQQCPLRAGCPKARGWKAPKCPLIRGGRVTAA